MSKNKVVSVAIFDPRETIFKDLAKEPASCETISCRLEKCPLRDEGRCTYAPVIGWNECPYGQCQKFKGPTKRARSLSSWIAAKKREYAGISRLGYPAAKMAFIGDYVFLPYSHIDLNKNVPFLKHGSLFVSGCRFLPRKDWTIASVISIIDFRPRAFMTAEEISTYQRDTVPRFLLHLKEADPEMWRELVSTKPSLDVVLSNVGRTALLRTLNHPIEWETSSKYKVKWKWDGKRLTTTSMIAYQEIWGEVSLQSLELRGVPREDAKIKILDDSWVNNATKFID